MVGRAPTLLHERVTDRTAEQREVAPGVYRFGSRRLNWYVVEGDDGLTVVEAGVPGLWSQLTAGLEALGSGSTTSRRWS